MNGTPDTSRRMTRAEVLALPLTVDIVTAGRALGIHRDAAYRYARSGDFPAPVIRAGHRYLVTRAALLAVLGIPDVTDAEAVPSNSLASGASEQVSTSPTVRMSAGAA